MLHMRIRNKTLMRCRDIHMYQHLGKYFWAAHELLLKCLKMKLCKKEHCNYHFSFLVLTPALPYANIGDIIFNAHYPELPPDFIFGEDAEFLPDPSALHAHSKTMASPHRFLECRWAEASPVAGVVQIASSVPAPVLGWLALRAPSCG
uniref:Uncharacterized protein n=1 Tax=Sphaerodactylus townsendi TaxID=933632 RepID=A0ACB8GAU8_9SAUR